MLDVPTTALFLTETQKAFRFAGAVCASACTVVLIGHNVCHVRDIAHRAFVIDRSRIAFERQKAVFTGAAHLIGMMHQPADTGRSATASLCRSA